MALTPRSLASAARRRVDRAQQHVHEAEEQLGEANKELAASIPSGDVNRIRYAHAVTQKAEKAVAGAADELDVAGELLSEEPQADAGADASGAGVRSLIDSMRSKRK